MLASLTLQPSAALRVGQRRLSRGRAAAAPRPAGGRRAAPVAPRAGLLDFFKAPAKAEAKQPARAAELVEQLLAATLPTAAGDKATDAQREQIAALVGCGAHGGCGAGGGLGREPFSAPSTGRRLWGLVFRGEGREEGEPLLSHLRQALRLWLPCRPYPRPARPAGGRAGGLLPQGAAPEPAAVGRVGRGLCRAARHHRGALQVPRGPRGLPWPGVLAGARGGQEGGRATELLGRMRPGREPAGVSHGKLQLF